MDQSVKFQKLLQFRCPASLPPAINLAAAKHFMTASEYVRRSVIGRLKADGIEPAQSVRGHMLDNLESCSEKT
jgi:hypothetical protein